MVYMDKIFSQLTILLFKIEITYEASCAMVIDTFLAGDRTSFVFVNGYLVDCAFVTIIRNRGVGEYTFSAIIVHMLVYVL